MRRRLAAVVLAALALPAVALAAPPDNDDRANARSLGSLPTTVTGTTVDATLEVGDPGSRCATTRNSVWYAFRAESDARIVVRTIAAGDLDASVDVYRRARSQLQGVACEQTDEDGVSSFAVNVRRGDNYLVRVGQLTNSAAGTFTLAVGESEPAARPPGRALPPGGRRDTVDRVLNPSDAWSVRLRAGVTYRINLSAPVDDTRTRCIRLGVYPPGTTDFEGDETVAARPCGGYVLFTPGPDAGGRYSLLAEAVRGRGALPYNIEVAPAGVDDTAPGIFVRNDQTVRGELRGGRIDVVDLYRFDVRRNSVLDLDLTTQGRFDLVLVRDDGRRVECSCGGDGDQEISRRVRPGRYFVAVRAQSGSNATYALRRISRAITSTKILINGKRHATSPPGALFRMGVRVSQGVTGPVTILVERFDPLAGWQFASRSQSRVAGGVAVIGYTPPFVGRWRARAEFTGTRTASPSESGYATVLVAGPLNEG